jgi:cytochrome P450
MQFDPLSPEFQHNPYPVYDQLRAATPILYLESRHTWFLSAYEDVFTLLRDRRLGRALPPGMTRADLGLPPLREDYMDFYKLSEHSMFDKEPPDHTRLRSLVHKVFTPRRVEGLRQHIQQITESLLDNVHLQGSMDILADFATPLPVTVIAELLGVPEEDRYHLRSWSQDIVAMYELDHTEEQGQQAVQAAIEFSDYIRDLAWWRKKVPQDDLISALAAVEDAGDQLTEDELISTCVLLLNAGHEATVNVIGNGMLALLKHPDQQRKLRDHPELVNTAVEEMMRYDTPLQLFRRWVRDDLVYKGFRFTKGMELALMFGAANRDPARFENPGSFDIAREDNPHISFGNGVHYCLGAPLARLELQIAIGTLLRRMPGLQLSEEPEYRSNYVIRGLKSLQVTF